MTSDLLSKVHVKAARALLGWSQQDLAQQAAIALSTVADFERGERTPVPANMDAIMSALKTGGITFLEGGPVVGRPIINRAQSGKGTPIRFVNASDLSQWADRLDSQSKMPELLTRLIRAEKGTFAKLRFPSDEGITSPGWDGSCEVDTEKQYIPAGKSAWEIGTQKNKIGVKATEDYNKRTSELDPSERSRISFVFVTPRQWNKKGLWVKEHVKQNQWADVRAYDAHDLVHWIELFPAVGHWIAAQVSKRPAGSREIEEVWQNWALSTKWPINSELILAGRDKEAARVLKWLYGEPSVLSLEADAPAEAAAFLYASLDQLPPTYREHYLYNCLMADHPDTARRLGDSLSSLVIALEDPDPGLAAQLVQKGHHVYAILARSTTDSDAAICLPKAPRDEFEKALIHMKIEKPQAEKLARETARSLAVLRRLIPSVASQTPPKWAESQHARNLIPALLAGSWDESREADKKALEQLAGLSYEAILATLTPWLSGPDAPLKKAGSAWKIVSPLDAWFRLASHFTSAQIDRYASVATDVLGSPDPRFGMGAEDRWLAGVRGQMPSCSPLLRNGISETLILLSLYGDQLPAIQHGSRRAEFIVRKLLGDASSEQWWSASGLFRTLAEASPEAFLDAVDESLTLSNPPVMVLFKEDDGFFGGAHHSNLLWALETLAWSEHYLPRSVELLAKLAALDPGGKYANRPHKSLVNIFRLWMPQTNAHLGTRLKVLDHLRRFDSNVSWSLMLDLLPKNQDYATPSPQPRWRDFSSQNGEEVTWGVIRRGAEQLSEWLMSDVGEDCARWEALIKRYPQFSPERRNDALVKLTQVSSDLASPEARQRIWIALRELLNHHRSFPEANWALPAAELDEVEKLYFSFEPKDQIDKSAWLFSEHIAKLPRPAPNDWRESETLSFKLRREVIVRVYAEQGYDGIVRLIRQATYPHLISHALAQTDISRDAKGTILRQALLSQESAVVNFASSLVAYLVPQESMEWARALLMEPATRDWPTGTVVKLLHALPTGPETWKIANELGEDIETAYWKQLPIIGVDNQPESVELVLNKLLAVHRPKNAAVFAAYNKANIAVDLIIRVLLEAAASNRENNVDMEDSVMFTFAVEELLQQLDGMKEVREEQIAQLEWAYLALLQHSRRPPVVIHASMSSNPDLFVEVLSAAFHPANKERPVWPPEEAEQRKMIASHAYRLLDSWRKIPGESSGNIDGAVLAAWVKRARQRCDETDRAKIGDQFIGAMLVSAPSDADGAWPAIPIRELIEQIRSRDLELGIQLAIHNSRGVTTRDPLEGGEQERVIARKYRGYSKATSVEWPRTSALLERIAKSFEDDAKIYDSDAQLTDWSY